MVNLDSQESNPLSFQQCNMSVHVDKSALLVRLNKKMQEKRSRKVKIIKMQI